MPAVLLALAAALCYSGSDFAAGLASRRGSVIRVSMLAEGTCALALLTIVPFVTTQGPTPTGLACGAGAGSGAVGAMALFMGFRYTPFSVASSVSAVGAAALARSAGLVPRRCPSSICSLLRESGAPLGRA